MRLLVVGHPGQALLAESGEEAPDGLDAGAVEAHVDVHHQKPGFLYVK